MAARLNTFSSMFSRAPRFAAPTALGRNSIKMNHVENRSGTEEPKPPQLWTRLSPETIDRMEQLRRKFPELPTISNMIVLLVETGLDHIDARADSIRRERANAAGPQHSDHSDPPKGEA